MRVLQVKPTLEFLVFLSCKEILAFWAVFRFPSRKKAPKKPNLVNPRLLTESGGCTENGFSNFGGGGGPRIGSERLYL